MKKQQQQQQTYNYLRRLAYVSTQDLILSNSSQTAVAASPPFSLSSGSSNEINDGHTEIPRNNCNNALYSDTCLKGYKIHAL